MNLYLHICICILGLIQEYTTQNYETQVVTEELFILNTMFNTMLLIIPVAFVPLK